VTLRADIDRLKAEIAQLEKAMLRGNIMPFEIIVRFDPEEGLDQFRVDDDGDITKTIEIGDGKPPG
jgi:hypothetical protein